MAASEPSKPSLTHLGLFAVPTQNLLRAVEYKYVVLIPGPDHGAEVVWQPVAENLRLVVPDAAAAVDVEDDWLGLAQEVSVQEVSPQEVSVQDPEKTDTPAVPKAAAAVAAAPPSAKPQGTAAYSVSATTIVSGLEDMTVKELKALASKRGLPVSGKKKDLVERLKAAGL